MIPRLLLLVGLVVLLMVPVTAGVSIALEPDLKDLLIEAVAVHKSDLEEERSGDLYRISNP
jgi:hypothetical protein